MNESMSYSGFRKKRRPRERPPFRDRDYQRDHIVRDEGREKPTAAPSPIMKQPVILAKPDSIPNQRFQASSPVQDGTPERSNYGRHDRPSSQGDARHYTGKMGSGKSVSAGSKVSSAKPSVHSSSHAEHISVKSGKETANEHKPVKIIDGYLRWADSGAELLEENQSHFLVVGVLGEQGVGKSALLSYLAGSENFTKETIFPCQSRDIIERAGNKTTGVDMYITEERTIFLDSQPILSSALLEQCIYNDRKLTGDYNLPAVGIEMQSLQIVSFLFSVCHVVIVLQDWFADAKMFNFIQCAEMLRLASPSSSDSTHCDNDSDDFYPHVIFAFNKAESTLFDPMNIKSISGTISNMFAHSKLLYKGSISLQKSSLFPNLHLSMSSAEEVNLFLIPFIESVESSATDCGLSVSDDSYFDTSPEYGGLPDINDILRTFRKMILSVRVTPLTRKPLTEKSWFYYAAKTWEAIKKSQMMAEFNRLVS